MPAQEPEAFRGISLAVNGALVDYKRIADDRPEMFSVKELVQLANLAGSPGQLWNKQVSERTARPKEYSFTVPSMVKGLRATLWQRAVNSRTPRSSSREIRTPGIATSCGCGSRVRTQLGSRTLLPLLRY